LPRHHHRLDVRRRWRYVTMNVTPPGHYVTRENRRCWSAFGLTNCSMIAREIQMSLVPPLMQTKPLLAKLLNLKYPKSLFSDGNSTFPLTRVEAINARSNHS